MMFVQRFQFLVGVSLGCVLLNPTGVQCAERPSKGREIYHRQCVKCHGKNGEGVKGKYDDALVGDWSLEKLTRYIDKNMPEDAPEKCVGPDAAAVARYINDTFYSREARARSHPPRIELARLTNRQYVNAVADLIKHFTGNDGQTNGESGLQATYYNSKDSRDDKKVFERTDPKIDFDFTDGRRDSKLDGTNGLSVQWRGSLVAEETGDYDFILKTPNGARLWMNNENEPVIDAWVSSGQLKDENKVTVRLLGGRVYPLRLNYFKFKEKEASVALQWKPPHGVQEPIPARNLSPAHVTPTFVVTTPFPADDSSVGYERGVSISKAWDEAATHAAIQVANHIVKQLDRLSHSKSGDSNRIAKVESFCNEFVASAFRRPLSAEQKRLFVSTQFKSAKKIEDAVKRVVLLTLKSPHFLYLGLDGGRPDDFEVATRLSFGLWDSLPDEELQKHATNGELHTQEQVTQEARRMLADPRAHSKIKYFLHQWLHVNDREDLSKDAILFPGFSPEIISDLRTSLNLFLEDVVWNGSSDYRQLLLAEYLFLNHRLAQFYGVKTNETDEFVKVTFEPKQRSGVVTHPYLLSALSYQKSTSPIHRGVFLTRNIVGRALKPPPMAQIFNDADFAPNLSMREKVATMTRAQSCQSCHSVINPLGFSLENFDAVGKFRTVENDKPIDAASEYITNDGETIHLRGARDVAEFAISSQNAQNSFIEQLFHQIVKQPALAYGSDTVNELRQSFVSSGFNVQKLLVDIVTISALHGLEKSTNRNKVARFDKKP